MKIVTDSACDLTPEQKEGLEIHVVHQVITLDGITYRDGIDIQAEKFYKLLKTASGMPTTSLPALGEFAATYRELAKTDPEILSVHISSGLSGTYEIAREAAKLVPEAHVTFFDTKTLSTAEGWHVEAAARAAKAGWSVERTVELLEQVRNATNIIYTLSTLKYLIHGGRISHIRGLLAALLKVKPFIAVGKEDGKYYQRGQTRTLKRALRKLVDIVAEDHPPGTALRVQLPHGNYLEGTEIVRERMDQTFDCTWYPPCQIAPVLAAHTGPGLVGIVYAAMDEYPTLP